MTPRWLYFPVAGGDLEVPETVAGLYAWYRELPATATAAQWDDKSGSGLHVTQAEETKEPSVNATDTDFNGLQSLQPDGVDDSLAVTFPSRLTSFSLFFSVKWIHSASSWRAIAGSNVVDGDFTVYTHSAASVRVWSHNIGDRCTSANDAFTYGSVGVFTLTYDGTNLRSYLDNTLLQTGPTYSGGGLSNLILCTVPGWTPMTATSKFNEVILYNEVVSDTDRASIVDYIKDRIGL